MELQKFIKTIISSIETALREVNKKSSQNENVYMSDISFDIILDVDKKIISVLDYKTIQKNKNNLNRIKFSIKYNSNDLSLTKLYNMAQEK